MHDGIAVQVPAFAEVNRHHPGTRATPAAVLALSDKHCAESGIGCLAGKASIIIDACIRGCGTSTDSDRPLLITVTPRARHRLRMTHTGIFHSFTRPYRRRTRARRSAPRDS